MPATCLGINPWASTRSCFSRDFFEAEARQILGASRDNHHTIAAIGRRSQKLARDDMFRTLQPEPRVLHELHSQKQFCEQSRTASVRISMSLLHQDQGRNGEPTRQISVSVQPPLYSPVAPSQTCVTKPTCEKPGPFLTSSAWDPDVEEIASLPQRIQPIARSTSGLTPVRICVYATVCLPAFFFQQRGNFCHSPAPHLLESFWPG